MSIGLGDDTGKIFLTNFDNSKICVDDRRTDIDREYRNLSGNNKNLIRYASLNVHNRMQESRRDDLESLAYMLMDIARDHGLPWNDDDGEQVVLKAK